MHVTGIVPAAGGGSRIGSAIPKQFLPLAGIPLLARTVRALKASGRMDSLIVVVPSGQEERCQREILNPFGLTADAVIPGGVDRQASVYAGLLQMSAGTDLVLVHDGARPFVTSEVVLAAVAAAAEAGAAVVAVPVTDTIKVTNADGWFVETPRRDRLWAAQTPQVFRAALLREAHACALHDGFRGTDDSVLVERLGHRVRLVQGSPENLKITTPSDLALADQILRTRESDAGRGR